MEDQNRDYELGQHAETIVKEIESNLKQDEKKQSYIEKSAVLNLVFRVADFMRQLSKRI